MNRQSDPLHNLADALSEDIVAASPEMLAAEAAQEPGVSVDLAGDFDRVFGRAERQARWRRVGGRLRGLMPSADMRSWRPAMAALAGIAVIVVAGDIYMNVQPTPPRMLPVSSEMARAREPAGDEILGSRRSAYRNEGGGAALRSAPVPQPSAAATAEAPRRIRTVPISPEPSPPAQQPAPKLAAPAAAPPISAAPPSATRAEPPRPIRTVRVPGIMEAPNPPPAAAKTAPGTAEDQSLALVDRGTSQGQSRGHVAAASPPAAAAIDQAENRNPSPSFAWPLNGQLVASSRAATADKRDPGIDIAVPLGTDVHAAADGVVAYAGDLKDFGNLVLVRHDDGFVTAYAHLDKILVKADDHVQRGQVIAKSGDSGTVSAPMLHFEIRKGSTAVDARQYLQAR